MRGERDFFESIQNNAGSTNALPSRGVRFHTLTSQDLGCGLVDYRARDVGESLHFGEKPEGTYAVGQWVCEVDGVDYYHTHNTKGDIFIIFYKGVLACAPKK